MKRVEEFLKLHPSSPEWLQLFQVPVCKDFEPRFSNVLGMRIQLGGSIVNTQGLTCGRFFRGTVIGLEEWDGPARLENCVLAVKNPEPSQTTTVKDLGETNALIVFRYAFAALIRGNEIVVKRPVVRDDQVNLQAEFQRAVSQIDLGIIAPFRELEAVDRLRVLSPFGPRF